MNLWLSKGEKWMIDRWIIKWWLNKWFDESMNQWNMDGWSMKNWMVYEWTNKWVMFDWLIHWLIHWLVYWFINFILIHLSLVQNNIQISYNLSAARFSKNWTILYSIHTFQNRFSSLRAILVNWSIDWLIGKLIHWLVLIN